MTESLIGLAAVLILAMLRLPIAFAMGLVGFVGFGLQISWSASLAQVGHIASDAALDYAVHIPAKTIAHVIGVDADRSDEFVGWVRGVLEEGVADVAKRGRHDPCIVPRVIPVLEAMVAFTLADLLLLSRTQGD